MQQIADWLQRLGLGQYAERFAENDIDFSVLPYLTDTDLKDRCLARASAQNSRGNRRATRCSLVKTCKVEGVVDRNPKKLLSAAKSR